MGIHEECFIEQRRSLQFYWWYDSRHGVSSGWQSRTVLNVFWSTWNYRLVLSLVLLLLCCVSPQAQEQFGLFPPNRSHPEEPTFPKGLPPAPLTRPQLPPIPPPSPKAPSSPQARLWLRQIRIEGNTVFSEQAISQVTQPYLERYVTSEDLYQRLTRLYINAGYVNSGAMLPDQTIAEGRVIFCIIKGTLSSITFSGKRWLRGRLTLNIEPPLNLNTLQDRIRCLQQDERIRRLDAELRPGIQRGESELHVDLLEQRPYSVELTFNNDQSPSVGAERGLITLAHHNVTGHGDRWHLTYGRSEGLDLQITCLEWQTRL